MAARGKCEEKTALRHKRPAACSQEKPSPKKEAPTFRYEGAKALLAPTIVAYIPKRGRKFIHLLAGRGNVTFRAMGEDLEYEEWILNDLNTAPFFRALRDHGDQVTVPQKSKQEFLRLAELAKQGDPEALLMEPWLAFNGGGYDSGGSTSSGGRRTPESYQRNLRATHKLIHQKNPRITSLDWRDCLEAEQPGPEGFVFVDGPYIGCNVGAYSPESISPCELVEFLKSATFNWILTEYRQPIYLEAFGAPIFEKAVRLRTPYCANTGGQERRIECIWTNVGKDPAKRDSVTVQVKPVPPDRKDT